MTARIFQTSRAATQSGLSRSGLWVLVFDQETPREIDPLMGWTSSADTRQQVTLTFATREEAVDYASRNAIVARVEEPKPATQRLLSYSDNFRSGRRAQWTH